jgi:hypothetical protein
MKTDDPTEPEKRRAYMEAQDAFSKMETYARRYHLDRSKKAEYRRLKEARDKAREAWGKTQGY